MGDTHYILDSAYSLREEMVKTVRAIHFRTIAQIHVQVAIKYVLLFRKWSWLMMNTKNGPHRF